MDWRDDLAAARSGDTDARDRLAEYFGPFVHGVLLSHLPHHVAHRLQPETLAQALRALPGDDAKVGAHVVAQARRAATTTSVELSEKPSGQRTLDEARKLLGALRTLPLPGREFAVLRLVEGISGEELSQTLGVEPKQARAALDDAAAQAIRVISGGDRRASASEYLWTFLGKPTADIARLETVLPVLRYDPTLADAGETEPGDLGDSGPITNVDPSHEQTQREQPVHRPGKPKEKNKDRERDDRPGPPVPDDEANTDAMQIKTQLVAAMRRKPTLRPTMPVDGKEETAPRPAPDARPTLSVKTGSGTAHLTGSDVHTAVMPPHSRTGRVPLVWVAAGALGALALLLLIWLVVS